MTLPDITPAPRHDDEPSPEPALFHITRAKTDVELATELRDRARPHLLELCVLMDEAHRAGLELGFNLSRDAYARSMIQTLTVVRPL